MIYLIDDKKHRQKNDFGWSNERFERFSNYIQPIYSLDELQEKRTEVFSDNNIILYHESFLDYTHLNKQAVIKRNLLDEFVNNHNSYLVYFSGSKSTRRIINNVAHLPVSILYQNLDAFINKYSSKEFDLKYLLYGENADIEKELSIKLDEALRNIDEDPAESNSSKTLFISTDEKYIQNPINGATIETIFDEESDEDFTNIINEWLSEITYDNIFLPLCFGSSLSDFNGLRLAAHIRCTENKNQLSNIFIYGFVGLDDLYNSQFFNVLKIKNIQFVDFKKKAFEKAICKKHSPLIKEELSKEIAKLRLDPPKNYEDNHSVTNEWAIYRWANAIGANNDEIEEIIGKVNCQLYFKYLRTCYPIEETYKFSESELNIRYLGNPRILYIDDETDKGWYEVLSHLLDEKLYFDYIGEDFKSIEREEIITKSLSKIVNDNIDLVILDFRLHPDDFNTKRIHDITGLKLLESIKRQNPGIQVIIFSATNKIWNFKAIQEKGADGFITKESPINSFDKSFIEKSIKNMVKIISDRLEMTFLKRFYNNFNEIIELLIPRKNYKKSPNPLPKDFVDEILKWYKLSIDIISGQNISDAHKTSAFIFMFSIIENLSNRVINIDDPIKIEKIKNNAKVKLFKFEFRGTNKTLSFFKEDNSSGSYTKTRFPLECGKSIPWNQKILNTIDFITNEMLPDEKLSEIVKKRNDFIHANLTTGTVFKISNDDLIWIHDNVIFNGLKKL